MFGFGTRYRKANFVGLLVVFAFLLLVGLLFASGYSQSIFNPPYLAFALQLFFVFGTGLAVAFVSAKSYLQTGAPNILLLGNAILISSLAFTVSSTVLTPEFPPTLTANQAVIIGNVGVLVSSLVLLVSAIVTWFGTEHNPRVPKKTMLAVSFLLSIATVTVVSVFSALNLFPVFLTSSGPTLLRLVVLALTTIFYFASSVLFGWQYVRAKSKVVYWFSLALALFGTAYLAGVLTIHLGSAMTWVSRLALYLAGAFLLLALLGPEEKTQKQPYAAKWSEAFRSNQKQMETFISKIAEGYAYCKIITDAEGKPVDWLYLDVNESYERINDTDRNKVVGRKATEVLPGIREDPADWINVYGHVALTGEPIVIERFSKDRDKWYRVSVYSPQKGYFVSLFEDITGRKKAEEEVAKIASFPLLNPNPVLEVDFEGNITYSNPATKTDFADLETLGLAHPLLFDWKNVLKNFEGKLSGNFDREVKVGAQWYYQTILLVPETKRMRIYTIDITERKKAEEATEKQAALIDLSPDAIIVRKFDGTITFWSAGAEKLYGWTKEDAIGQDVNALLRTEFPQSSADIQKKLGKDGKRSGEIIHICKDGSRLVVQSYWLAKFGSDGKISELFESNVDITSRVEMQFKLEESAVRLEEYANQMEDIANQRAEQLKNSERLATIGATAGMVGHDIRNPLQAITGDVYLAKTELASTPESEEKKNVQESLTEIEKNVDYINKIVQDLQDFARPLNPRKEETDLKLVIDELLKKNDLPEDIKVTVKVEPDARKVVADSTFITRIMYNLVTNAAQAMPKGGKLTIHAFKKAKGILITVKDTGVGIPEKVKGKLFTPMFTTKSKGQGFGLSVVKRMTEALGGSVTFESQEGKGTTFTVRLPTKS